MKTKIFTLLLAVAASIGTMFAAVQEFAVTIPSTDFVSSGGYAANNNEKTSTAVATADPSVTMDVKWTSYQVMLGTGGNAGKIQGQKNAGVIYNAASWGKVKSITINDNSYYTYTIGNELKPSATAEGGFFQVKAGSATSLCSSIVIKFEVVTWDYVRVQIGDLYYNLDATSKTAEVTSQPSGKYSESITIPASVEYNSVTYTVTSIGSGAFSDCSSLTSVTIGNSVTSIGMGAFSGCSGLTSISVAMGNTVYDSRNNCNAIIETATNTLMSGCQKTIIHNSVTSIGYGAFSGCTGLTSITIPNSVTCIRDYAFYNCSSLTAITIPNSVTSIGYGAFSGCTGLTSITIPNSVTSIGESAFSGCVKLTSVTINSDGIMGKSYAYHSSLIDIFGEQVKQYIIGNSVTSIGGSAFYICSSLTSVTIPNSVTSIGERASYGCSSLTAITIPNSVTSIGDRAFYHCRGLTSVTIEAEIPPALGVYALDYTNDCPIYVPCGTIDAYKTAWPDYGSLIKYAPLSYKISTLAENGSIQVSSKENYTICDERPYYYTLTVVTNYGYHFTQWSDGNTDNPRTIVLTQDTTFTAEFAKNTYTISTVSANPESGTTTGDTTALYLDEVEISAIPNYGYHFVRWNDNNTSNPRIVSVTEDKTFTATFAKNVYSITKNAEHGSISGNSSAEYLDEVTLTVTADNGYHFTQWSDGNTDNPRTIVLTQDTTMEAIFDYLLTGSCGQNNALTWTLDTTSLSLNISGSGVLSENYTYGNFIKSLTIGDEISVIGQSAFAGFTNLRTVIFGSSVKVLEANAFSGCTAIDTITCYSMRPPTINIGAFEGLPYSTIVYVPADYLNNYVMHDAWGLYDVRPMKEPDEPCIATNDTIYANICHGDSIEFGGQLLYLSGVYVDSLLRICGQDSIVTLMLNVITPVSITLTETIEQGEVYRFGDKDLKQQGIYQDTLQSVYGCDSAYLTLILFVEPLPTYVINVVSNNTRYGVVQGGGTYPKKTKTTISAVPLEGYRFVRWSDGNKANPRPITVMSDSTFMAFFAVIKYNIVAEPNEPMLGSVIGGGEYLKNEKATLMVNPYKGSKFTQWSDGNKLNPRSVTVTSDSTFTAVFASEIPVIPETTSDTMFFTSSDTILRAVRIYSPFEIKAYDKLIVATTNNHHIMGTQKDHYHYDISYTPLMNTDLIDIVEAIPSGNYFRLKTAEGYLTPGGQNRNALYAENNGADWKFYMYNNVVIPQTVHYNDRMILYNEQAPRFSSYRQVTGLNRYQTTVYKLIAPIIVPQEPEHQEIDSTLLNEYKEVVEDIPTEVEPTDTTVVITTPYVEYVSTFTIIVWADAEHTQCVAIISYTSTGQIVSVTYPKAVRRATRNSDISLEICGLEPNTQYYCTLMACDDDGSSLQTVENTFTTTEAISTDIDSIDSIITPVKIIRDGQLFIQRGNELFNAQGARVK